MVKVLVVVSTRVLASTLLELCFALVSLQLVLVTH